MCFGGEEGHDEQELFIVVGFLLEFNRLCQQWGAFDWNWLSSFRADMALYKVQHMASCFSSHPPLSLSHTHTLSLQGDHNLAMQILRHEWQKIKTEDKSKVLFYSLLFLYNLTTLIFSHYLFALFFKWLTVL